MTKKQIRELLHTIRIEYNEDEKAKEIINKIALKVVNFRKKKLI